MAKNKKVIKEQKKYQNRQERYEEMNDYLLYNGSVVKTKI